jgi:uncharacterized membrane protein
VTFARGIERVVPAVTYEEFMADVVRVVEAAGAAIMIVGAVGAFALTALRRGTDTPERRYETLRGRLGRVILLGLEVLIIGDIVRTVTVEPTLTSVAVLAAVVLIRIVLSFAIEVEIDGVWPWRKSGAASSTGGRTDV